MPVEAIVEWGITLFIFALLALACAQAIWPGKPEEYSYPSYQNTIVETRAEAEARAIIEQCWPDEVI